MTNGIRNFERNTNAKRKVRDWKEDREFQQKKRKGEDRKRQRREADLEWEYED
ncbi:MAG: hypothetical protein ACRDCE_20240 [Cetobacterium sp.]|uniref:hypothetical protein n=1 Tax=Cetobacterium sp. TaxID=2071632 RepID=UPI003EE4E18E